MSNVSTTNTAPGRHSLAAGLGSSEAHFGMPVDSCECVWQACIPHGPSARLPDFYGARLCPPSSQALLKACHLKIPQWRGLPERRRLVQCCRGSAVLVRPSRQQGKASTFSGEAHAGVLHVWNGDCAIPGPGTVAVALMLRPTIQVKVAPEFAGDACSRASLLKGPTVDQINGACERQCDGQCEHRASENTGPDLRGWGQLAPGEDTSTCPIIGKRRFLKHPKGKSPGCNAAAGKHPAGVFIHHSNCARSGMPGMQLERSLGFRSRPNPNCNS